MSEPKNERIERAGRELVEALGEELANVDRATAEQRLSWIFSGLWNKSEEEVLKNLHGYGGRGEGPGRKRAE
jgi:hypothetical protein